jgi:hypothetical protein
MEDKYWILDTNNLSDIKNTFIGYTVSEEGEFFFNKRPDILDGTGCYTCIEVSPEEIVISQDFLGMQGIYHYKNEKRNIFSNGYLKIVDYLLNNNCTLSIDKNFCVQYIFSNEEPINMNDTILKEIKRIGKDFIIKINLKDGDVNFIEKDYEINSIKVDKKETIDILDKWHNKWCNVYRNLVKIKSPLLIDLSGGMDTRICFGLLLNSNIDKNNIIIKRNVCKKISYQKNYDDWEISQEIVDKYKYNDRCNLQYFKNKPSKKEEKLPIFEMFDNLIFGNSKICDYKSSLFSEPIFHINGIYGDRNHLGDMAAIKMYIKHKKVKYSKDMKKEDIQILADLIDKYSGIIFKKFESKNRPLFLGDYSFEYINRFFGSKVTSKMFQNDVLVCPFADPSIHKIQIHLEGTKNYFALASLIYNRYFEDLINFKFQTDFEPRVINEEEIKFAKDLCAKYPFVKIEREFIPDLTDKNKIIYKEIFKEENVRKILEERLKKAENEFVNIFGKEYFQLGMNDLKLANISMQNYLTPIVSICSVLNLLNQKENK